jgi:hypothetical protein
MSQTDFWYIRFPDGRILRAASTIVLRQELDAGHIPLASTVRRSPNDEWVSLEWTREFSDLVDEVAAREPPPPPEPRQRRTAEHRPASNTTRDRAETAGARLDPSRLPLVGVRGYLDELLNALDSTLVAKKLLVGALAGLVVGALFALERAAWFEEDSRWRTMALSFLAVGLVVVDALTGLLTRLTYIELARLRPARWREALVGLGGLTVWIVVSQLLVRGAAWGLIVLLRWLPFWLGGASEEAWTASQQILSGSTLALGMFVEALLWPLFFFWWLLPPLLVVEDCTVWRGLLAWLRFLRQHLGRVFLYQTMAVGLGVLLTAPFLILIAPLLLPSFYPPEPLREVATGTRSLLLGLACAPLLTYWITSNMFIYLNLRYGAGSRR